MRRGIKSLTFLVAFITIGSSYSVYAKDASNIQKQDLSVELSSKEKKKVFLEQKEVVEKIKKENPNSDDFAEKMDKIVKEDYNTIDHAVENKAEKQAIPLNCVSEVETNVEDQIYQIDKNTTVIFSDSSVCVDLINEKERNATLDEEKSLENDESNNIGPVAFIKNCFITPVHAASKSKTKEVEYRRYVTDTLIKSLKVGEYYISCEFTYNKKKVTARRTGNYVKAKGIAHAVTRIKGVSSAVQKPSSKRRIAYVSGTIEAGVYVAGVGLTIDSYWARLNIECNQNGTVKKYYKHS